jgi:predicted aminopeptidase
LGASPSERRGGRRAAKVVAAVIVAAVAAVSLTRTGRYLVRAGVAEAGILARSRAITAMIDDSTTEAATRQQLRLVLAARRFAADSLGLRVGGSFTRYSRLAHDTLVLVLSGAYRDRLQAITWWYPIVGEVPYKGYFDFGAAVRAETELRGLGFDVDLRPSPAFSTLGWFSDPLESTTLREDSLDLANTVIHEVTHNTYYGAGQVAFNESFANFTGARGAAAFFRARGDSAAAREVEMRWADEKALGRFWSWTYAALDSAFRAHPGNDTAARDARLAARDSVFRLVRDSLTTSLPLRLHTIPAAALARARLDNAVLLARRVYLTDLDDFDAVYERSGGDLGRAISEIIQLARGDPRDPFGALRRAVRMAAGTAIERSGPERREETTANGKSIADARPLRDLYCACACRPYRNYRRRLEAGARDSGLPD